MHVIVSGPALPVGVVSAAWKFVYVPVPKAACTSMLWTLADVQQETAEPLGIASAAAVTRSLLVHEPAFWRRTALLQTLPPAEWSRICGDDEWLIFTITRDPVSRLWSAWQSKLLMREPRFVGAFGDRSWFPRIPRSPRDVVEDFRRFVEALGGDQALLRADRHWQPQVELLALDRVDFTHVGTASAYARTLDVVEQHLAGQGWRGRLASRRENATLIGLNALGAVDEDIRHAIESIYADDMRALGYAGRPAPERSGRAADEHAAQLLVACVRAIAARHERVGDLLELLGGARTPPL
jgi:Sulfotransferase family